MGDGRHATGSVRIGARRQEERGVCGLLLDIRFRWYRGVDDARHQEGPEQRQKDEDAEDREDEVQEATDGNMGGRG